MAQTFKVNINVTAETEYLAKQKVAVVQNLLANFDDSAFGEVFAKIQKDSSFFKKLKNYLKLL